MTIFKQLTLVGVTLLALTISAQSQPTDPLGFPKDSFTEETIKVATSNGEKEVTYRSYLHIPYVAKPVDVAYQSLNVYVPVAINGQKIDAANSPILFIIGVGGYMSVKNIKSPEDDKRFGQGPGGGPGGQGQGRPPQGNMGPGPGGAQTRQPGSIGTNEDLALAYGYVVVAPGCRGRDNQASDGTFYGKAPAAIVDLKAAVRYIRHNKGVLPGNTDWIVSRGCSAGGDISALLGASGNSPLYEKYLVEIGAADERDDIFGAAAFSPIADLEHADMAYEWMYGTTPTQNGLVDQQLSAQLKALFVPYMDSLNLQGKNGFGKLSTKNYGDYLTQYYLIPSTTKYLQDLSETDRSAYLKSNPWISWEKNQASFSFEDYLSKHIGRMKGVPAFDDFEKRQPEPNEFGDKTTASRHFTDFSLQHETNNPNARIDPELRKLVYMMNPMYFIRLQNKGCASNWWIRNGSKDAHTSQTVAINLVTGLENQGKLVNSWIFWNGGHCADNDPEGFIQWIGQITQSAKK